MFPQVRGYFRQSTTNYQNPQICSASTSETLGSCVTQQRNSRWMLARLSPLSCDVQAGKSRLRFVCTPTRLVARQRCPGPECGAHDRTGCPASVKHVRAAPGAGREWRAALIQRLGRRLLEASPCPSTFKARPGSRPPRIADGVALPPEVGWGLSGWAEDRRRSAQLRGGGLRAGRARRCRCVTLGW